MHPRNSTVNIAVKNLRRSVMFYKEGMGLSTIDIPEDATAEEIACFSLQDSQLSIRKVTDTPSSSADNLNLTHKTQSSDEVDDVLRQAWEYGAHIVQPAQKTDQGEYIGSFEDPDGYLWEVVYKPGDN